MADRRSLGAALSLTPEKVQFIKNDKNDAFETGDLQAKQEVNAEPRSQADARPQQPPSTSTDRPRSAGLRMNAPAYAPTLVSVTTRLQQATAVALRRAYLEQKLNRQFPDTQQEIIEEALQHWLYEHGFLS